jgi:hypothetical protein
MRHLLKTKSKRNLFMHLTTISRPVTKKKKIFITNHRVNMSCSPTRSMCSPIMKLNMYIMSPLRSLVIKPSNLSSKMSRQRELRSSKLLLNLNRLKKLPSLLWPPTSLPECKRPKTNLNSNRLVASVTTREPSKILRMIQTMREFLTY